MELHLSGEKLKGALESLIARADEHGGVETYVAALKLKAQVFRDALDAGLELKAFRTMCAHMATVRRRIGRYAQAEAFPGMKQSIDMLLDQDDTQQTDRRIADFCSRFPDDRDHRWVRDLAAELLHNADPERYPLMTRWVWDARANTGVLREIWHGENVDGMTIEVPDTYATFVQLREELAQYLTANGVFRDVLFYADMLVAQVYADYIGERGGTYLRTDFSTAEDPMLHARRILGLDGVSSSGKMKLKAADGRAEMVQ
ncbi:MAG TPA: hypothetical protein VG873_16595 [Burkholderiales bacterium]|nr:hypothetical protein [Burkholderiales bacterium]